MSRSRLAPTVIGVVCAVAITTVLTPTASSAADPVTPTDSSVRSVVVLLRDQLPAVRATAGAVGSRAEQTTASQNAVLSRLAGRKPTEVDHFVLANAFAATVTGDQVAALWRDPAVASVGDNVTNAVAATTPVPSTVSAKAGGPPAAVAPAPYRVPAGACRGTRARPQLEPEGLDVIGARSDRLDAKTAAALGYDGSGVKVAFIADSLDPSNVDFRRANGSSAIVENTSFDPAGAGLPGGGGEAFGDAGTIVGQGRVAHDLADWVSPAAVQLPGGHCWIRVEGVAPGASLVALDAPGDLVNTLQAIDHAVTVSHVDVLNESFGSNIYPEASARNALAAANTAATAAGVTVVTSSGDAGVNSTIASPAASSGDGVIAVGATTHLRAQVQTGGFGLSLTGATQWNNDQVDAVSSSGVTSDGHTVDLVAPGYGGWAPCSTDLFRFPECTAPSQAGGSTGQDNGGVEFFAGTSQAAPFTSGTAALVIQAYRATHSGKNPSPSVVEQILTSSATDIGAPADQQGAGRLDARAAVEVAAVWSGTTGPPAGIDRAALSSSTSQVSTSGAPGTGVSVSIPFRNSSNRPVTLAPTLRELETVGSTTNQVALTPDTAVFTDMFGRPTAATTTTVDVPADTDRVRVSVSGRPSAGTRSVEGLTLALYDPSGALSNVGLAQNGNTAYSEISVDNPSAGQWTAVVTETVGGSVTSVQMRSDFSAYGAVSGAVVSPASGSLNPGGTGTVRVTLPVTASGSSVYTLDPGTAAGRSAVSTSTVPVIVQGVLTPTAAKAATITAELRGGNGRLDAPAQTLSYLVEVPSGAPTLTVDLRTAGCGCEAVGLLVDPAGQVRSTGVNENDGATTAGVHQTVASPETGTWRWIIQESPVTSRSSVTAAVRGTVTLGPSTASAALPSAATKLVAGQTVMVPVTISNPSKVAPMTVLIDAQRSGLETRALPEITGNPAAFTLPFAQFGDAASQHLYLVPPGTTSIAASTTADTPVQTGLSGPSGGTFVVGSTSTRSKASVALVDNPGQGVWSSDVAQVGPFPTQAPAGSGSTVLTGVAPAVDRTVTSPTGANFADGDQSPVTIGPGRSAQIQVSFTPPASWAGRTVSGRVIVSTGFDVATQSGTIVGADIVALLPYRYTVVASTPPA